MVNTRAAPPWVMDDGCGDESDDGNDCWGAGGMAG
jgi:hypothetical protein